MLTKKHLFYRDVNTEAPPLTEAEAIELAIMVKYEKPIVAHNSVETIDYHGVPKSDNASREERLISGIRLCLEIDNRRLERRRSYALRTDR
jgi:hypothetical protein